MDAGGTSLKVFRPETFFLGRTEGWGVVRELGGRRRRCTIVTNGHMDDTYGSLHFDEVYAFDDGETQDWRWAMTCGSDGRYVAAEALAGAGIAGRHDRKGDYVLAFRRPLRPEGGFPTPRYHARFTLVSPGLAMKTVKVSLFGLPVGLMTAFHQRV